MVPSLPGPLSSSRCRVHFAVRPTPLDTFSQFDTINILKVKLQLQDGWKGIDVFLSRMRAVGRLTIVQQSDISVKIYFLFLSVEKLLYPRRSWKRRIA